MLAAILGLFQGIAGWLTQILPVSPFADMSIPSGLQQGLGWLNWFLPLGDMLALMAAVLALLVVARVAVFLINSGTDLSKLATGGK